MNNNFDYYYGDESNQFSFFRIPRQLVTEERFKRLSTDAKLLYGLLMDRMALSAKNGWYDEAGRVYIYYTLEEIQEDLSCGHDKATKLLVELDTGKTGYGLIERVRQGQGRPTKIYVKRFTSRKVPPRPVEPQDIPRPRLFSGQDCGKAAGSYIESNQTDISYTDPSIHLSSSTPNTGWIDRYDCEEKLKKQLDYSGLCQRYAPEDVEETIELITDTLNTVRPSIRIGGETIPTDQVQKHLLSLEREHLEYVFDCLRRNTSQIRNIRACLLTALYNAPTTISQFYQAEIRHDFGPIEAN